MPTCQFREQFDDFSDDDLQSLEWLQNFDVSQINNFPIDGDVETRRKSPSSAGVKRKSQCSFGCVIFRAIEESPRRALPLRSIYEWIETRRPDVIGSNAQWKNTVRHSLSLKNYFIRSKAERKVKQKQTDEMSGNSLWAVHPDVRKAYSRGVLAEGAAHTCLPRGGAALLKSRLKIVNNEPCSVFASNPYPKRSTATAAATALKKPLSASNLGRKFEGLRRSEATVTPREPMEAAFVISRDVADDHCYASENPKCDASAIIDLFPQSTVQGHESAKSTIDASVQVCFADFEPERKNIFRRGRSNAEHQRK